MAYWCDDRALDLEQRLRDADQQRAQERERARAKAEGREPAFWAVKP